MNGFYSSERVRIDLGDERSYHIAIGTGLLAEPAAFEVARAGSAALIVTNTTVAPLYADALARALAGRHSQVARLVLPDGEQYKTWDSLNLVFDALLGGGFDRKTTLYALGGGVVGDMTGCAAACYMRGVPFVQVPPTDESTCASSVVGTCTKGTPRM